MLYLLDLTNFDMNFIVCVYTLFLLWIWLYICFLNFNHWIEIFSCRIMLIFLILREVLKAPDVTTQIKLSESANTSPSFNSGRTRKRANKNSLPHAAGSSRSSLHMFPIISGLVDKQNLEIGKYFVLMKACAFKYFDTNWTRGFLFHRIRHFAWSIAAVMS